VGASAADANGGHQREPGLAAIERLQDGGDAAVVDAPGGVGAAVSAVREDDGVDAGHGRHQGGRRFKVAADEFGAGQEPLSPGRVAHERTDVEPMALCRGDDTAADAASRPDDEHGGGLVGHGGSSAATVARRWVGMGARTMSRSRVSRLVRRR
jgi:hypothetical protein